MVDVGTVAFRDGGVRTPFRRLCLGLLVAGVAVAGAASGAGALKRRLATTAAHLYWVDFLSGFVVEANLNGSNATKIVAEGNEYPLAVAVGPKHLYWANGCAKPCGVGGPNGNGAIVEATLSGKNAKTIVKNQKALFTIAVAGGHLYWVNGNTIVEANPNGTGAKTIESGVKYLDGIAASSTNLYWATLGPDSGMQNNGTIVEANLDGSGAKTIATQQSAPMYVAVSGSHLYWADGLGDATIVQASLDGTNAKTIVTSGSSGYQEPGGVAVGGGHLYWDLEGSSGSYPPTLGTVVEARPNGSSPKTIAHGQNAPAGLAIGP